MNTRAMKALWCGALFAVLAAALSLPAQETKVPDAETLVGRPAGRPLTGDQLTQQTQQVASSIRCPVCQGLSITDSPSEMAQNMRAQVRALLERGYTEAQIFSYFERSYGQFVLLRPKFEGVNSLVWILPVGVLLIGSAMVMMKLKSLGMKGGDRAATAPAAKGTNEPDDPSTPVETDPYLARVRELVKGDGK